MPGFSQPARECLAPVRSQWTLVVLSLFLGLAWAALDRSATPAVVRTSSSEAWSRLLPNRLVRFTGAKIEPTAPQAEDEGAVIIWIDTEGGYYYGSQGKAPASLSALIRREAERHGLDPRLVELVIQHESNFDPYALSPAGAMGLMQLMPGTAAALGVADPFDPAQNVAGGTAYLAQQLERFGSVELALAAYNAGPGAVERYGGIPPYAETRAYVASISSSLR